MDLPVPPPDPPVGGPPVVLAPGTYARHAAVVRYVEGMVRVKANMAKRGRTTWAASGAWGFLTAGASISGSSGTTLGSGTVTLCSRVGDELTADGEDVTVYNAGGSVTAGSGGRVLKLGWTDGVWSLDVFPCS